MLESREQWRKRRSKGKDKRLYTENNACMFAAVNS